jgi:CRP-like cAMP-binding protein
MDLATLKRGELQFIENCFLFKGTDQAFLNRALGDARCRLIEAKRGAVVFDVHDYRNSLGFILAGRIEVTKPSSSRYVMNTLEKGSLFGSADLYDEGADVVTVLTASAGCRIVFFPRGLLESLMREDSGIAFNYIRFLTGRLRFLNEKILGLVAESAVASLNHYLAVNAEPDGDRRIVRLSGSVSALAEQLNIGRASLYRAFDALERDGLIRRSGKEIEIVDSAGLTDIN